MRRWRHVSHVQQSGAAALFYIMKKLLGPPDRLCIDDKRRVVLSLLDGLFCFLEHFIYTSYNRYGR
jgi:hypothetical protein